MEEYFTIDSRYVSKINTISNIRESISSENPDTIKLQNMYDLDIEEDVKRIIVPSRCINTKSLSRNIVDMAFANFTFGIIKGSFIYHKIYKIYSKVKLGFTKHDIEYVDKEEADVVFFDTNIDDNKEGSNLLLNLDIKENIEDLIELSHNFRFVRVYRPDIRFDETDDKTFVYFMSFERNSNEVNTRDFFLSVHNNNINRKIELYRECIKMKLERNFTKVDGNFNFISPEIILNL